MDCHIPGESSCKKPGASNKMSDSDRPLKKARFAWQVKGKYHLRDQEGPSVDSQENIAEIITTPADLSDIIPPSITPESDTTCKAEENLEILGDYLLKQDFSGLGLDTNNDSLDASIKPANKCDESTSSNQSSSVSYPVYMPSEESASGLNKNVYISLSQSDPESSKPSGDDRMNAPSLLSMAHQTFKTEDHCLARWQARQLAKGFVDNTINRVLESWFVSPMPPFENNRHTALALDVAEFFEFLPTDNRVENEGILMAISAHGLHNSNDLRETERERILNLPLGRGFGAVRRRSLSDSIFIRENCLNSFNNNENDDNASSDPPVTDFECLSDTESSPEDNSKSRNSPAQTAPSLNLRNSLKRPLFESMISADNIPNVDTSSLRHLPNSCNCRNVHTRRNHAVSSIPFHRRDSNVDMCPILPSRAHECSSNSESIPSIIPEATLNSETPKSPESCLDQKPEDSSSDDESDDQAKNDFMESDEQMQEHFDFMDAAVSFAIQNKGLTSFGSVDYG